MVIRGERAAVADLESWGNQTSAAFCVIRAAPHVVNVPIEQASGFRLYTCRCYKWKVNVHRFARNRLSLLKLHNRTYAKGIKRDNHRGNPENSGARPTSFPSVNFGRCASDVGGHDWSIAW